MQLRQTAGALSTKPNIARIFAAPARRQEKRLRLHQLSACPDRASMDMVAGLAMQSWHASADACSALGKRWKECLMDVMADGDVPRDASYLRVEMMCSRLCSIVHALCSPVKAIMLLPNRSRAGFRGEQQQSSSYGLRYSAPRPLPVSGDMLREMKARRCFPSLFSC